MALAVSHCLLTVAVIVCYFFTSFSDAAVPAPTPTPEPTFASLLAFVESKERAVGQLVNATQRVFETRCTENNLCTVNTTRCTMSTCGGSPALKEVMTCSFDLGVDTSLCGKECAGLLRSTTTSTISMAAGATNNQESSTFVCSTASLTSVFADLFYNQGVTGWQYVASNTGVTRQFPAAAQSGTSCSNPPDTRQQSWYVSASTGPKDIVLVCDFSGSMNAGDGGPGGMTRANAMRVAVVSLLDSLGPSDRFNIICFTGSAVVLGSSNGLMVASPANIALMQKKFQNYAVGGGTSFGPAMKTAFSLLADYPSTATGCARIIMFLTDGQPGDGTAVFDEIATGQARLGNNPARIFSYSLSANADHSRLQRVACENNAIWSMISDATSPTSPLQQYYNFIAAGMTSGKAAWTSPYASTFGQGTIVTVSQPIFDMSQTPKIFVGVAAIDVVMSDLLKYGAESQVVGMLAARTSVCLSYDMTPCQMQKLREPSGYICPSPSPPLSQCTTTHVTVPNCNTTIVTNINEVVCASPNASTAENATQMSCCSPKQCRTKTVEATVTESRPSTVTIIESFSKTLLVSGTQTVSASQNGTTTITLRQTPSVSQSLSANRSDSVTHGYTASEAVSGTLTLNVTTTESSSTTPTQSQSRSGNHTVTDSATVTASRSLRITDTNTLGLTRSSELTPTATWGCVNTSFLRGLFEPYTMLDPPIQLLTTDAKVANGTSFSVSLPPLPGLEREELHMRWFEPFEVPLWASLRPIRPINTDGFARREGFLANITIEFPEGLGTSTLPSRHNGTVRAIIRVPRQPSFLIYTAEAVDLSMDVASLSATFACNVSSLPFSQRLLSSFVLMIYTPTSILVDAGRTAISSIVVASSLGAAAFGGAAPDMQVMVMTALMPCAGTYQKRSFAMFRAISPFAISDTFEGVLWGNLLANCGVLVLHVGVVVLLKIRGMSLGDAATAAWFPNISLQVMIMTYPGTVFSAIQILTRREEHETQPILVAAGMLLLFGIGYPVGALSYIMRNVVAVYDRFEYGKWRRESSPLRVRVLSTFLLPVGSWDPRELRRRYGTVITLQCRPEYVWITYPSWSPLIVAILGAIDPGNSEDCLILYSILGTLHLILCLVIVYFRPFRTMIEDCFAALGFALTGIFMALSAAVLKNTRSPDLQDAMWVLGGMQLALLVARFLYHIAHIFIARRLRDNVPHSEMFSWNRGEVECQLDEELLAMNDDVDPLDELSELDLDLDLDDDRGNEDDRLWKQMEEEEALREARRKAKAERPIDLTNEFYVKKMYGDDPADSEDEYEE
jgi:hypothetical protein